MQVLSPPHAEFHLCLKTHCTSKAFVVDSLVHLHIKAHSSLEYRSCLIPGRCRAVCLCGVYISVLFFFKKINERPSGNCTQGQPEVPQLFWHLNFVWISPDARRPLCLKLCLLSTHTIKLDKINVYWSLAWIPKGNYISSTIVLHVLNRNEQSK